MKIYIEAVSILMILAGVVVEVAGIADDSMTVVFGGAFLFAMGITLYKIIKK